MSYFLMMFSSLRKLGIAEMSAPKGVPVSSNYEAICEENQRRYGTEGALKSGGLAAGLYDNRTHFIFELLQNAEDALGRREGWTGPRKVAFELSSSRLRLSHFGKPFDESDVRSVCDIAESTKQASAIGRFGLGFKSVYTVTNLPEIHSGDEDFAIEDYVFPRRVARTEREADETQIILPLRPGDPYVERDITAGFRHLGPGALLFLRHIEEITWGVDDGPSGFYMRYSPEALGNNVKRVTVIGQETGQPEVDQNWLVFHRNVFSADQQREGRVEIAFLLVPKTDSPGSWAVKPLASSPLVVFFPTVVESHLGFLVQGPYRTTPGRDNIVPSDPWNQNLIAETAKLLVDAMCWMRGSGMLDVSALCCLPLDSEKFAPETRFALLFDAVRSAFQEEALLPTTNGTHVMSHQAKLARRQELRELFSPQQVAALLDPDVTAWLTGDITQDKTPDLHAYLRKQLDIDEIRPEKLISSLTKPFLEAQTDEWVLRLYEFLSGLEKGLRRHLDAIPIIRLDDGTHVVARKHGELQAFLPSSVVTGFRTIRRSVCATADARAFLISLGIDEPNPVDDVIWNVLPKYRSTGTEHDESTYAADIERIRAAFSTDSTVQKDRLRGVLRDTCFVMAVDTGNDTRHLARPSQVYIASERLKKLFAGVEGVFLVDDAYECLRGENIRELLVACGASRYLSPEPTPCKLSAQQKTQIRKEAGLERATSEDKPEDFTIRGLEQLLQFLTTLEPGEASSRAGMLWDALVDLEGRGGAAFYGTYRWSYSHESKTARFDAAFIRRLNEATWVPSHNGELVSPDLVTFDSLGWKPNHVLQSKISFKPPIIDQLAKVTGIDPAVLDLLRKNPEVVAELLSRANSTAPSEAPEHPFDAEPEVIEPSGSDVYGDAFDLYGEGMPDIPAGTPDPDGGDGTARMPGRAHLRLTGTGIQVGNGKGQGAAYHPSGASQAPGGKSGGGNVSRTHGQGGARPFISYVGVYAGEQEPDPDGLDQQARMKTEAHAIELIIKQEPQLRRTPDGNPGFDLFEADNSGRPTRWVEVKSMTGSLDNRPVGLSRAQFEFAQKHGDAYWLYVVERTTDAAARVLRIQNPAGQARTFTFDRGWSQVALTDPPD